IPAFRLAGVCAMQQIVDAYSLLSQALAPYRELDYHELAELVGEHSSQRVKVDANAYVLEVTVRWRRDDSGDIVVEGMAGSNDCGPLHRTDAHLVIPRPST